MKLSPQWPPLCCSKHVYALFGGVSVQTAGAAGVSLPGVASGNGLEVA